METIVPEARGRAEALRTYLAQGGPLTRSGRYTQGRLKNKTLAQAQVEFDRKWGGASGRIKDKYANMAGKGAMSPSELADYESRVAGVGRSPKPAEIPVAEEAKPAVNKDLPLDERNPNHGRAARVKAVAPILPREAQTRPVEPVNFAMQTPTIDNLDSIGAAMTPAQQAAATRAKQKPFNFSETAVGKAVSQITNPETIYNQPQTKNGEVFQGKIKMGNAPTGDPLKDDPPYMRSPKDRPKSVAATPVAPAPTPLPAQAPPATPQEPIVAGVAPSPKREIAFDGRRNLGDVEADAIGKATRTRVNAVTGLPAGYRPGDALPEGADQAMKDAAAASVARQAAATAAAPKPQVKPMVAGVTKAPPTPGGPSLEEGWAKEREREALRPQKALPVKPTNDAEFQRSVAGTNFGLKAGPIRPLAELTDPRALKPLAKPAPSVAGITKTKFSRRI